MPAIDPTLVARLHDASGASRWNVSVEAFGRALEVSARRAFPDGPAASGDVERYLRALRLEDLALAVACAQGDESAWDHFVVTYRPALYRAADAIDPTGDARDLADSLYADLFGLTERGSTRPSLFRYFHGRSRLSTWLGAVLAQRHVDRVRTSRRLTSLSDDDERGSAETTSGPDPSAARHAAALNRALADAIAALAARDRLRLGLYYGQDLTLAAIGRTLGEHEATVSRHLSRTRSAIRRDVERRLRKEHGLSQAAVADCLAVATADAGSLDLAALVGAGAEGKNPGPDRSR